MRNSTYDVSTMLRGGSKLILFFLFSMAVNGLFAQSSVHRQFDDYYSQFNYNTEQQWDRANNYSPQPARMRGSHCPLEKEVYGWHPYWSGSAYTSYDFSLLSTISYFSYNVNPATGNYTTIRSWKTTNIISLAHAAGCRVELCVTLFGSSSLTTFLNNATARQTLIDSLLSLVQLRNADGVNIDFEGLPSSQRTHFTTFMTDLSNAFHTQIPNSTVSMALYSVDWNNVFDIPVLNQSVDQFVIMGYGYYWSGSSKAGPISPLYSGSIWGSYNLVRTVNYYLGEGMTPVKLLVGLPYYGREWQTVSSSIPSSAVSHVGSRTYSYVMNNYKGVHTRQWDAHSATPYYVYQSGGQWRQCFVDDEVSLAARYEMITDKGIGGIGIWALGYDNGYSQLWDAISDNLSACAVTACSDTFYDMGGPHADYYDDEDYIKVIDPPGASSVTLTFDAFDLENNFDYLYVHDGPDTNSPVIATLTGSVVPSPVTSSGSAITLRFVSDGAINNNGWQAHWACSYDTGYCSSVGLNSSFEWIEKLCVGPQCHVTGNNGGYGDFSHLNVGLKSGKTYNFSLHPGFAASPLGQHWSIWIDYNRDGDLNDPGELVFDADSAMSNPATGSFTLPNNLSTGLTLLRFQMKRGTASAPCEHFAYGEVQDYAVRLKKICAKPANLSATNVTLNSAFVTWDTTDALYHIIRIRKYGTTTWSQVTSNLNWYAFNSLQPNTTYEVRVKSICSDNTSSKYSTAFTFTTLSSSSKLIAADNPNIVVYPNPLSSSSLLSVGIQTPSVYEIRVINMAGKQVYKTEGQTRDITTVIEIPVENWPTGIYQVMVNTKGKLRVERIAVL